MRTEQEIIAQVLEHDPELGSSDVSKCLPGWIKTFCEKFEQKQGYELSHDAVSALCHTLIAARIRAERLVRERDELKLQLDREKRVVCRDENHMHLWSY